MLADLRKESTYVRLDGGGLVRVRIGVVWEKKSLQQQ